MILGNFFSKKLLIGLFLNFPGILVHIRTIKMNFFVTNCSVEMDIFEHVRRESRAAVAKLRLCCPQFFPEIKNLRIFLFLV